MLTWIRPDPRRRPQNRRKRRRPPRRRKFLLSFVDFAEPLGISGL